MHGARCSKHRTAPQQRHCAAGGGPGFNPLISFLPLHLGTALLNIYLSTVSGRRTKKSTCDGWAELPTHAAVSPTRVSHLDASDDEGEM